MSEAVFSLDAYERLLDDLRARGYQLRGYPDAAPDRRDLVLRHDIDMSPEAAVAVAEREQAAGASATYFALVRSEFYNPLAPRVRSALRRLVELGHALGLHFDASLHPGDRPALERACAEECELLEDCLGAPVGCVSFHRPAPALLGIEGTLAGRRHAYEPRFFSDMGYCSDSRGGWHHGHPLDHPAVAEGRALQLLTHPIWWVGPQGDSPVERLDRFAAECLERTRRELAANCEPYARRGDG